MSRGASIEAAYERKMDDLAERRNNGAISDAEFHREHRELLRQMRDETEAAMHEDMEAVREDYGYW